MSDVISDLAVVYKNGQKIKENNGVCAGLAIRCHKCPKGHWKTKCKASESQEAIKKWFDNNC